MIETGKDEGLHVWLGLQITRANRKLVDELQALDRRYAAARDLKSGSRIANAIKLIEETIVPLAERIYERAPNRQGYAAIHNYFSELNDTAIWIAKSAGARLLEGTGEPDLTMRAAIERLDKIRDDLAMQWRMVELSSKSSQAPPVSANPQVVKPASNNELNEALAPIDEMERTPRGSPAVAVAWEAIQALFPDGEPNGMRADIRNAQIRAWCEENGRKPPPSDSSIGRARRRRTKSGSHLAS